VRKLFAVVLGAASLLGLLVALAPVAPASSTDALQISSDLRVVVLRGRDVALEVLARGDDDYASIAGRISNDAGQSAAIAAWNHERPLVEGLWVQAPFALLSDDYRSLCLRTLFPRDRHDGEDWIHVARSGALPIYDEGLWQVAVWFTGGGASFDALLAANGLDSPELRAGQAVRVPAALLHPAFHTRMRSDDGSLEYGTDDRGPYAAYRLRSGEAVYSAVVVRFTGRTSADDVVVMSDRITERSEIADVTDIPAGFEIKIPLDLLEPEFLPAGHPRRLEMEARRSEMARELAEQPVVGPREGLEGVLIVLDPGHGGRDRGTWHNGVWEHDYVYDVTCRLKRQLETRTSARAVLTLEDRETGCVPSTTDALVANHQGTILTTPPFLAREEGEATIGVNLRWYLANSIYRKALRDGYDSDRVVFISIHADSRHPSLRGVMVYVPGADYRTKTYGHSSSAYKKYREVQEKPHVSFSKKKRLRSEAVSRKLADEIVRGFENEGLPVQPYQPVRDKVIRGKSRWVPAVLRGNAIPDKVLVEMVNLSNARDAELLGAARDRDRMARAILNGVLRHFGEPAISSGSVAAAD